MIHRTGMVFATLCVVAACVAPNVMPTAQDGAQLYAQNCAICHGADATGGTAPGGQAAPDLTMISARNGGSFPRAEVLSTIDGYGKGRASDAMPEFGALLEDAELVPVLIDGTQLPTPRPLAAVLFYLESIQTP
ncbi:MAG: cytochrome c [Marinibacterium sp.]|nr:cytochrome c [Marinibacterium sp.]